MLTIITITPNSSLGSGCQSGNGSTNGSVGANPIFLKVGKKLLRSSNKKLHIL
jgi:hypothetical protein